MRSLRCALAATLLVVLAPALPAAPDLAGKVAVITGTSSGLGRELAELAAEREMRLVLVDIDPGPSIEMAREIVQGGGQAVFVEADLADPDQRAQIVETAVERFGTVDVLMNNAGYSYLATLEQMDLDQAHHLFEVNYWAYVDLAQRVIPLMKAQGSGILVNVASILGVRPSPPGLGHYAATKHALVGLFQAAAEELEPHGISVHVANPAGMATDIARNSVGPLAEGARDRADDWEDPAIPAADIFAALGSDAVLIYPGYIGDPMQGGQ
jgi:NAD(P)-dependent dehydrogenase (short-subunit alcohol dehydrogenase family)